MKSDRSLTRRAVLGATGGTVVGGLAAAARPGSATLNVGVDGEAARRAVRDRADAVVREFDAIDAVTVRVSGEAADALGARPDVRYVEADGRVQALSQTLPWGVDRIDAEVGHANGERGAGADVAIVDTGIDSDHPDLTDRLGDGHAVVECVPEHRRGFACNDNTCHVPWDDDNGHGTAVAGVVGADDNDRGLVGVAPDATLHAAKVLECDGSGSFSDVATGIEWVADSGHDVAVLGFGGDKSSVVEDAVEYAADQGVTLVAPTGGDGPCTDCVDYPAAEPEVIAVGATTESDALADFSSTGPEVELAAPGEDVPVLTTDPGETAVVSGTSLAAAHAGGAASLLAATGLSRSEIRRTLKDNAEDLGLSSNEQGAGLVDAAAALGLDSSDST